MPPYPSLAKPEPFMVIRVRRDDLEPSLCGLCVGYEQKQWRLSQFAEHILDWLPEFALRASERESLQHSNSLKLIRQAARTVYQSAKFQNRGEFGEIFLHAAIRQVYDSIPAISKIYFKTAVNETVKGFDAVHVVGPPKNMELWLGEVKFYKDVKKAIAAVVKELKGHLGAKYLRSEFSLIAGKLDDKLPHYSKLKTLLSPNTSLDDVFKRLCIPVLLTYDSECLAKHSKCSDKYIEEFKAEVEKHHEAFVDALCKTEGIPDEVRIHLFLLPLHTKEKLIAELDKRLKAWQ
jgi:hypothetical protein